jgi:hypothetical protein
VSALSSQVLLLPRGACAARTRSGLDVFSPSLWRDADPNHSAWPAPSVCRSSRRRLSLGAGTASGESGHLSSDPCASTPHDSASAYAPSSSLACYQRSDVTPKCKEQPSHRD